MRRSDESGLPEPDIVLSLHDKNQRQRRVREREMNIGQLVILAIGGVGVLVALMTMAFFAQKNTVR
ncbi:hypothetical protein EAH79_02615 [Sphingomonas koreensis]|nr:hypothetical protein EAH79_02615 [Sphingomonas koreensis]